jgi:hypothetical protein
MHDTIFYLLNYLVSKTVKMEDKSQGSGNNLARSAISGTLCSHSMAMRWTPATPSISLNSSICSMTIFPLLVIVCRLQLYGKGGWATKFGSPQCSKMAWRA